MEAEEERLSLECAEAEHLAKERRAKAEHFAAELARESEAARLTAEAAARVKAENEARGAAEAAAKAERAAAAKVAEEKAAAAGKERAERFAKAEAAARAAANALAAVATDSAVGPSDMAWNMAAAHQIELDALTKGMKKGLWTREAAERRRVLEKKLKLAMRARTAFGQLPNAAVQRRAAMPAPPPSSTSSRPMSHEAATRTDSTSRPGPTSGTRMARRLHDARRRDAALNT